MKRALALLLALAVPCLAAYDKRLVHVLEQLRSCSFTFDENLPMVGGAAVGDAGSPHEFYLLLPYIIQFAGDEDLRAMLNDRSPVVRIMAAACIVKKEDKQMLADLEPLSKDTTRVYVAPFGCVILKLTVAEVVSEIKKHPRYFEGEEEPNQHLRATGQGKSEVSGGGTKVSARGVFVGCGRPPSELRRSQ
jgi:hypothetical protein